MLLYAIYEPGEHHNRPANRERVYAFASVERLVKALHEVNGSGTGSLTLVTKFEAYGRSALCILYTGIDENGVPAQDARPYVHISEDGFVDDFYGSYYEIRLAQTIAEEKIPRPITSP